MVADYEVKFEKIMSYAKKNFSDFKGGTSDDLRAYLQDTDRRGLLGPIMPYLEETRGWERTVTDKETVDFAPVNIAEAGTTVQAGERRKLTRSERRNLQLQQSVQAHAERGHQVVYRRGHPIALYGGRRARDLRTNRWTKMPRLKKEERK